MENAASEESLQKKLYYVVYDHESKSTKIEGLFAHTNDVNNDVNNVLALGTYNFFKVTDGDVTGTSDQLSILPVDDIFKSDETFETFQSDHSKIFIENDDDAYVTNGIISINPENNNIQSNEPFQKMTVNDLTKFNINPKVFRSKFPKLSAISNTYIDVTTMNNFKKSNVLIEELLNKYNISPATTNTEEGTELKSIREAEPIINNYKKLINYILTRPLFLKLSSLEPLEIRNLILKHKIYIEQKDSQKETDDKDKTKMVVDIADFMYVDIHEIINTKDNNKDGNNEGVKKIILIPTDDKTKKKDYHIITGNFGSDDYEYNDGGYKFNDTGIKCNTLQNGEDGNFPEESEKRIYINDFLNMLSGFVFDFDTTLANILLKWKLLKSFLIFITKHTSFIKMLIETVIVPLENRNNNDFNNALNKSIEENSNNNIISYLKLRNDEVAIYNKRFNIEVNEPEDVIRVDYNADNKQYYQKTESGGYKISDNFDGTDASYAIQSSDSGLLTVPYDSHYTFGKFTKIFLPDKSNGDIANNMETIKSKINEGKPVFIIGYGASGAGKTSSLIYFKNAKEEKNKDGILINLCNQYGESGKFTKIELKCKEFYHTTGSKENPNIVTSPDSGLITFTYKKERGFTLDQSYTHAIHHKYRLITLKRSETKKGGADEDKDSTNASSAASEAKSSDAKPDTKCDESIDDGNTFPKETTLGQLIIFLIDTDRFVKATTNNPNSSRSHTLVFVKLSGTGGTGNIIVGDFAGVENKFACENPQTTKDFLNVKRDDAEKLPYYSTEAICGDPDPILGGGQMEGNQTGGAGICDAKIKVTEPVFDFNAPVFRTTFDPKISKIFDNDTKEMKKYIDFIRRYNKKIDSKYLSDEITINKKYNFVQISLKTGLTRFNNFFDLFVNPAYAKKKITEILGKGGYMLDTVNNEAVTKLNQDKSNITKTNEENIKKITAIKKTLADANTIIASSIKAAVESNAVTYKHIAAQKTITPEQKKIIIDRSISTKAANMLVDLQGVVNGYNKTTISYINNINKQIAIINYEIPKINTIVGTKYVVVESLNLENIKINSDINKMTKYIITSISNLNTKYEPITPEKIDNEIAKFAAMKTNIDAFIRDFTSTFNPSVTATVYQKSAPSESYTEVTVTGEDIIEKLKIEFLSNNDTQSGFVLTPNFFNALLNLKDNDAIGENDLAIFAKIKNGITKNGIAKDRIGKITGDFDLFFAMVKEMELETYCRQSNSGSICKNRTTEGIYINNSLAQIRKTIKKILYEKNKDKINIVPSFMDDCLVSYYPNLENVFRFKPDKETNDKDAIFDSIIEELTAQYDVSKYAKYIVKDDKKSEEERKTDAIRKAIYHDIIISIFCVFNISRGANNPPPTPYIDINKLKRLFYYGDILNTNKTDRTEFQNQVTHTIEGLIQGKYRDKVSNLDTIMYPRTTEPIINLMLRKVTLGESNNFAIDVNVYKAETTPIIESFINMIDNSNAVSAIGTLEFVDQLSKFNTINTICESRHGNDKTFKEITGITGGSKSFKKRKNQNKNTKKNRLGNK